MLQHSPDAAKPEPDIASHRCHAIAAGVVSLILVLFLATFTFYCFRPLLLVIFCDPSVLLQNGAGRGGQGTTIAAWLQVDVNSSVHYGFLSARQLSFVLSFFLRSVFFASVVLLCYGSFARGV